MSEDSNILMDDKYGQKVRAQPGTGDWLARRPPDEKNKGDRLTWIDINRAVAILAVVLIHLTSRAIHHTDPSSTTWAMLAWVNRGSQFAVPAFLVLSTMLCTRSLRRRLQFVEVKEIDNLGVLGNFYRTRFLTILWPYLLWSAIYMGIRYQSDVRYLTPAKVAPLLLLGKAFEHLYFLWVLLQLLLILPFLTLAFRKRATGPMVGGATLAATAAFYLINLSIGHQFPDLIRSILDYIPAIGLGLWLGSRSEEWDAIFKKGWLPALCITVVAGLVFIPIAIKNDILGHTVSGVAYQWTWWVYTTAASFLLMAISHPLERLPVAWMLQGIGIFSLQIYLLHPLLFFVLDNYSGLFHISVHLGLAAYLVVALVVPMVLAGVLKSSNFSVYIFGR